ncbi:hypothetical protein [Herbaspirillum sp. ST 5-3]|uniref:hypothetical protein n=1 Tax=Oxalobacteraceae TaxID=75682 RepID=UPI0010A42BB6|nr:hypothetical protein [Herbaspirillum sp. ST 5-3]
MKNWREAIRDGAISGSIASLVSTAVLGGRGQRDTGTPFAPTNAISHWIWGDGAAEHDEPSTRYTGIGYVIHHASSTLWAVIYEKWFGEAAERGEVGRAVAGGAAVAGLACFVDYNLTPQRLQPGFEKRLSTPSMFLVYASFGMGLALRGLATSRAHLLPHISSSD